MSGGNWFEGLALDVEKALPADLDVGVPAVARPLDPDRQHALESLLAILPKMDVKARQWIEHLAARLPPSSVWNVRESVIERRGELQNPAGYAINALRSEERQRRESAERNT